MPWLGSIPSAVHPILGMIVPYTEIREFSLE
jgi:hypothetical protein